MVKSYYKCVFCDKDCSFVETDRNFYHSYECNKDGYAFKTNSKDEIVVEWISTTNYFACYYQRKEVQIFNKDMSVIVLVIPYNALRIPLITDDFIANYLIL